MSLEVHRRVLLSLALGILVTMGSSQVGEFQCDELADEDGNFTISQPALDAAEHNLQRIVDCVPEDGMLVFEPFLIVKPNSTVKLERRIKLTSNAVDGSLPKLMCSEDGKALFEIRLKAQQSSAILIDVPMSNTTTLSNDPEIAFESIKFLDNKNGAGPGVVIVRSVTQVAFVASVFADNHGRNGGAVGIYASGVQVVLESCILEGNQAAGRGGAVYQESSSSQTDLKRTVISITNSAFDESSKPKPSGGAIALEGGLHPFTMRSSEIVENTTVEDGGGIWVEDSQGQGDVSIEIHNTTMEKNSASVGGAISLGKSNARLSIIRSTFRHNKASGSSGIDTVGARGGAIVVENAKSVEIKSCRFVGNSAVSGNHSSIDNQLHLRGLLQAGGGGGGRGDGGGGGEGSDQGRQVEGDNAEGVGGAIFMMGSGRSPRSRVSGAPITSLCSIQCDPSDAAAAEAGIVGAVDGCGSYNGDFVCLLKDPFQCSPYPEVHQIPTGKMGASMAASTFIGRSWQHHISVARKLAVNPVINLCDSVLGWTDVPVAVQVNPHGPTVEISDSTFTENEADLGGSFAFSNRIAVFLLKAVDISYNRGSSNAGALYLGEDAVVNGTDVVFHANQAGTDGGAVLLKGINSTLRLTGSLFSENRAVGGSGGAISAQGTDIKIDLKSSILFVNNIAAGNGGAIEITSRRTLSSILGASFWENMAGVSGGALYIEASKGSVQVYSGDLTFRGNSATRFDSKRLAEGGVGGAIMLLGKSTELIIAGTSNVFSNNTAREGGAVRVVDCNQFELDHGVFEKNIALSGGGIHASFTRKPQHHLIALKNVSFHGNTAFTGGGLMADAKKSSQAFISDDPLSLSVFRQESKGYRDHNLLKLNDVRMWRNQAARNGGGMVLIDITARCRNCEFRDNWVDMAYQGTGGAVSLQEYSVLDTEDSLFMNNSAVTGGGLYSMNSLFMGMRVKFKGNEALVSGGAVRTDVYVHSESGPVGFELRESIVDGNKAATGGGLHFDIENVDTRDLCRMHSSDAAQHSLEFQEIISDIHLSCRSKAQPNTPQGFTRLLDTTIRGNSAKQAGGGIFITNPKHLCVCCDKRCSGACISDEMGSQEISIEEYLRGCEGVWGGNQVKEGGYGEKVASASADFTVLISPSWTEIGGDFMISKRHSSGQPLRPFTLQIVDHFRQVVTNTPGDLFTRVTSEHGILSGQVDKQVIAGLAEFNSIIVSGYPREYTIKLELPEILDIKSKDLKVVVRDCTRGELVQDGGGFRCVSCPDNTYSFTPTKECSHCPGHSICDGPTLVPRSGYWHSTSQSTNVIKCLIPAACSYTGRETTLRSEAMDAPGIVTYSQNYTLCRKGYGGVLCGSCEEGYGRVNAFDCQKCLSKPVSIVLMVLAVVWSMVVIAFLVRSAVISGEIRKADNQQFPQSSARLSEIQEVVSSSCEEEGPNILLSANAFTESLKILINFLQVSSIALIINTNWSKEIRRFLQIQDFLSGLSSNGGIFSLDCPMDSPGAPQSVQRSTLSLLLPLGLMVVTSAFWAVKTKRDRSELKVFKQRAITSILTVSYFFYTGITKRGLRILHKITVDDSSHGSGAYAATEAYWADDTSLHYMRGSHLLLSLAIGFPFLVVFSIGFPVGLFILLWRKHKSLNDKDFAQKYGFLYRSYRKPTIYWEVVIMLRKALLLGVVVFAYSWEGVLQGLLALIILVSALAVHLIKQPYREELSRMNNQEALSQFGSVLIYMGGLAFNEDALSKDTRRTLAILLIIAMGLVLAYLTAALFIEGVLYIDNKIEDVGLEMPSNANLVKKVEALANHLWNGRMHQMWTWIDNHLVQPLSRSLSLPMDEIPQQNPNPNRP